MFDNLINKLSRVFSKNYIVEPPIPANIKNIYNIHYDKKVEGTYLQISETVGLLRDISTYKYDRLEYFNEETLNTLHIIPYYINNGEILDSYSVTRILYNLIKNILSEYKVETDMMKITLKYAPIVIIYQIYNNVATGALEEIYIESIPQEFISEIIEIDTYTLLNNGYLYEVAKYHNMRYSNLDDIRLEGDING